MKNELTDKGIDELTNESIDIILNKFEEEEREKNIEGKKKTSESIRLRDGVKWHKSDLIYDYSPNYRSHLIKAEDVAGLPSIKHYPIRPNIIKAGTYILSENPVVISGLKND